MHRWPPTTRASYVAHMDSKQTAVEASARRVEWVKPSGTGFGAMTRLEDAKTVARELRGHYVTRALDSLRDLHGLYGYHTTHAARLG